MSTPYASPHSHQERYEENCNDSLFECEKEDDMQSCPLEQIQSTVNLQEHQINSQYTLNPSYEFYLPSQDETHQICNQRQNWQPFQEENWNQNSCQFSSRQNLLKNQINYFLFNKQKNSFNGELHQNHTNQYSCNNFNEFINMPQLPPSINRNKQQQCSCNCSSQMPARMETRYNSNNQYSIPQFTLQQQTEQQADMQSKPTTRNYYQILLEYEQKQKDQQIRQSQDVSITNSFELVAKKEADEIEACLSPSTAVTALVEREQKIKNSNKKNVVKNIMSAFKNFILETEEHFYNPKDLLTVLELYNSTKKGLDDLSEMKMKFKRYITSKNFNHYTVKLLISHTNYSKVFRYFLSGPINDWMKNSKIADVSSHTVMINFLKDCFEDISLIDFLKRHEKKRAHFQ